MNRNPVPITETPQSAGEYTDPITTYLRGTSKGPPTSTGVHRMTRVLQTARELRATAHATCDADGTFECTMELLSGTIIVASVDQEGKVDGTSHSPRAKSSDVKTPAGPRPADER